MPLFVILVLCLRSVWPASGHETRDEGRKIVYQSNALSNSNHNELLYKTHTATNHSSHDDHKSANAATSDRIHVTKSTHFANVEPKVVNQMPPTLLEYPVRSVASSATSVPTSSSSDVRPPVNVDSAGPVYTADQYIDYYWQPPTPHPHLDIQHSGSGINNKQTPDEDVFVLDSPVAAATSDNNVVRIPTGLLVGLSTVQRTVFIVIERIRSMWDFVWSYFRVPGTDCFELCIGDGVDFAHALCLHCFHRPADIHSGSPCTAIAGRCGGRTRPSRIARACAETAHPEAVPEVSDAAVAGVQAEVLHDDTDADRWPGVAHRFGRHVGILFRIVHGGVEHETQTDLMGANYVRMGLFRGIYRVHFCLKNQ